MAAIAAIRCNDNFIFFGFQPKNEESDRVRIGEGNEQDSETPL